jgi:protein FrlC
MELGFDRRDIEPDYVARQSYEYLKPLVDEANRRPAGKSKVHA